MTGAKARRVPKVAEPIDLYWVGESKGSSLDHAATVALPLTWRSARFRALRKKAEGGNILDSV
jgi:hypothetical protein